MTVMLIVGGLLVGVRQRGVGADPGQAVQA